MICGRLQVVVIMPEIALNTVRTAGIVLNLHRAYI